MYKSLHSVYLESVQKSGIRAPWLSVISEADVEQVQPEGIPVKDIKPKKSSGPAISGPSISYDDVCNKVINSDPQLKKLADEWVAKKIPLLPTTTETNSIPQHYQPLWKELYKALPPKAGEIEGGSKGSGNGELALYWFLKPTNPLIQDNRTAEVGAADLIIKGDGKDIGIEVKSSPDKGWIKIGRFSKNETEDQKMNNMCLDTIFGLDTLLRSGKSSSNEPTVDNEKVGNILSFDKTNLKKACISLLRVASLVTDPVLADYDFLKNIGLKIKQVADYLQLPSVKGLNEDSSMLANILMYKLLITKIKNKPGDGGFFVNVDKLGTIVWLKVDFVNIEKKFKKIDNEYVKASTGALFLHKDLLK
jgi:hypothetical protein